MPVHAANPYCRTWRQSFDAVSEVGEIGHARIDRQAAVLIVVDVAQAYCPQFVHQMANGATVVGPNH
jgi:hypothetical protein